MKNYTLLFLQIDIYIYTYIHKVLQITYEQFEGQNASTKPLFHVLHCCRLTNVDVCLICFL